MNLEQANENYNFDIKLRFSSRDKHLDNVDKDPRLKESNGKYREYNRSF